MEISRKAVIVTAIVIAVWGVFLWRTIVVLGPDSLHSNFDSDSAIPVLMANDDRPITVFDWYYYGQDRWGGWPMILARIVHSTTHFHWSDQRLHITRTVWLFIGILILASLNQRAGPVVVVACLIPITLDVVRLQLFDLSQVYSWQITALVLGWFCARRLLENQFQASADAPVSSRRFLWYLLLFFFSLLSIWSSPASAPMLGFLVALEVLRAYLKSEKALGRRLIAKRFLYAALPVVAATLAEILMRMNYHRHGLKHYGTDFRTPIGLDIGYLATNLRIQMLSLSYFTWWFLMWIPLVAMCGAAVVLVYFRLKARHDVLTKARRLLLDETAILIAGTFGIAAINFALTVVITHVRVGAYHTRFMTLTVVFGSISGVLTIYFMLYLATKTTRIAKYVLPALAISGLLFLFIYFPVKIPSPKYKRRTEIALNLAQKTPGSLLMGGYWETYVFTALQPVNAMTALPLQGRYVRLPWTPAKLQDADQIVVEYRESKFADTNSLPPQLEQYGVSLRLVDPKFYENGEYSFALYQNESSKPGASRP